MNTSKKHINFRSATVAKTALRIKKAHSVKKSIKVTSIRKRPIKRGNVTIKNISYIDNNTVQYENEYSSFKSNNGRKTELNCVKFYNRALNRTIVKYVPVSLKDILPALFNSVKLYNYTEKYDALTLGEKGAVMNLYYGSVMNDMARDYPSCQCIFPINVIFPSVSHIIDHVASMGKTDTDVIRADEQKHLKQCKLNAKAQSEMGHKAVPKVLYHNYDPIINNPEVSELSGTDIVNRIKKMIRDSILATSVKDDSFKTLVSECIDHAKNKELKPLLKKAEMLEMYGCDMTMIKYCLNMLEYEYNNGGFLKNQGCVRGFFIAIKNELPFLVSDMDTQDEEWDNIRETIRNQEINFLYSTCTKQGDKAIVLLYKAISITHSVIKGKIRMLKEPSEQDGNTSKQSSTQADVLMHGLYDLYRSTQSLQTWLDHYVSTSEKRDGYKEIKGLDENEQPIFEFKNAIIPHNSVYDAIMECFASLWNTYNKKENIYTCEMETIRSRKLEQCIHCHDISIYGDNEFYQKGTLKKLNAIQLANRITDNALSSNGATISRDLSPVLEITVPDKVQPQERKKGRQTKNKKVQSPIKFKLDYENHAVFKHIELKDSEKIVLDCLVSLKYKGVVPSYRLIARLCNISDLTVKSRLEKVRTEVRKYTEQQIKKYPKKSKGFEIVKTNTMKIYALLHIPAKNEIHENDYKYASVEDIKSLYTNKDGENRLDGFSIKYAQ